MLPSFPPPSLENTHSQSSEAKTARFMAIGLCLIVITAFSGVVRCDFVELDDRVHVLDNPIVAGGLNLSAIYTAFVTPHAGLWIPLTWVSFMIDISAFGMNPVAMHAINLAFHVGATLLLFFALRALTGKLWECAVVAALFGLHPINVESVAWVTERKNVLCAFFWMATLRVYAQYAKDKSVQSYLWVLVGSVMALLAKPMAVTLPFALLLLDVWPLQRNTHTSWLRLFGEKTPLFALVAFGAWMQMRAVALVKSETLSTSARVSNAIVSYVAYLRDLVWPVELGVLYPHPQLVQILPATIGALVLIAISVTAWWKRKDHMYLLVGWCWFLGTLFPMMGLVQVGAQARADRFTYIAQLGVFIAVVWLFASIRRLPLLAWLAVGILGCFTALTLRQVTHWENSIALFKHTEQNTIGNGRIECLTGYAHALAGDYAGSLPYYREALRHRPNDFETWNNLGDALSQLARDEDAAQAFAQALKINPQCVAARYNLGNTLRRLGRDDEAISCFRVVVNMAPELGLAHLQLGRALAEAGESETSDHHLRTAARLLHDPEIAHKIR